MDRQRLLTRFLRYVGCDSESKNERAICEMLEQELKALGLSVWRDEVGGQIGSNGWNIGARLPGEGEPLLFSCHTDTVSPGNGVKPVVADGTIRSSGDTILGADDKSGIAAVMEALETIVEQKLSHRPIEVLFSVCEELGLLGAKHADFSKFSSKQGIVLDGGEVHEILNRAPANVHLQIEVRGKGAHAGVAPEDGLHALKAAAAAIDAIPCGYVGEMSVMNVANFLAPGKTNVVPDRAGFEMEIRSFEEPILAELIAQTERALENACAKYGTSYTMKTDRHSQVLHVPEDSALVRQLCALLQKAGHTPEVKGSFGGCDATWLNAAGIGAVNIGTGMREVHGVSEQIAIADLEGTTEVVLGMMRG